MIGMMTCMAITKAAVVVYDAGQHYYCYCHYGVPHCQAWWCVMFCTHLKDDGVLLSWFDALGGPDTFQERGWGPAPAAASVHR
jgi:hypothetical protein